MEDIYVNNMNKTIRKMLNSINDGSEDSVLIFQEIGLLFEKNFDYHGDNESYYKNVLREELYDYYLTDNEIQELISNFKKYIEDDHEGAYAAASALSNLCDNRVNNYLVSQFERKYLLNPVLATYILRVLAFDLFSIDLLKKVYESTYDDELKDAVKQRIDVFYR
ncbi:MAG TPA: hypothetical protein PLA54_11625 [Spirochaetota bacterium]|nr:hypothetical protein [Spirochaetota bacterium]HOU85472.1 hypothetical protein [Spirochaetota bacterium]HPK56599.1 hypothetical protein [Spirochaetota bacterium]HQE59827.1 hypothetical protein [Spirochaetota bacterium]